MISGDNQITIKKHRSGDVLSPLSFNFYNYHREIMHFDSQIEIKDELNIQVSGK